MKISEAKEAYSSYLQELAAQRRQLQQTIKGQEEGSADAPVYDKVELSSQLTQLDAQYEATQKLMQQINTQESLIVQAESSKQQSEAAADSIEELIKVLKIFRRVSKGDKVPAYDEKKLMEYSDTLYLAAKNMALLEMNKKHKKHKSLWGNEEEEGETASPQEVADNTEISVPAPESVAAE